MSNVVQLKQPKKAYEQPNKIIWTDEMVTALKHYREIGHNLTDCADKIGVCINVVTAKARELNIHRPLSRGIWTGIQMQAPVKPTYKPKSAYHAGRRVINGRRNGARQNENTTGSR